MTAPNLIRGFLYPSQYRSRCHRFHACIVSQKCQNFDRHNRECITCESRMIGAKAAKVQFGGFIAEGTYSPDLQDAMKCFQDRMQMRLSHPDREMTQNSYDIVNKSDRLRRATDKIEAFSNMVGLELEHTVANAWYDPKNRKLCGRLD